MEEIYVKAALYMYQSIPGRVKEIDNIVRKKALASMTDYRPVVEIADDIITLKLIKAYLIKLHNKIRDDILPKLKPVYVDCIYYKYFRGLKHTYQEGFDYRSRTYMRRQHRVVQHIGERLAKAGFDDEWFESVKDDPFIGAAIDKAVYVTENHEKTHIKNNRKEN